MTKFCGACSDACRPECDGAFERIGIAKVHWECWSQCNLKCSFCYRSRTTPLDTRQALSLIDIVATSGARWITFAGGDPSLRVDFADLVSASKRLGLQVEVQTNAQQLSGAFRAALHLADQVGLSLDGPTAVIHDTFRSRTGNFLKVMELLDELSALSIPTVVRSVVAADTYEAIPMIAHLLKGKANIKRWSLLEFVPLGDGAINAASHKLPKGAYESTLAQALDEAGEGVQVDGFSNDKKAGVYALVSPNGQLYGTQWNGKDLSHLIVGNLTTDHLSELAARLPFVSNRHLARYGDSIE